MFRYMTLGVAAMAFWVAAAQANDCCDRCGCQACCRKVCRLVCETKKVPKTCYSCECEDFCIPGPSECCGTKCECECDECAKCNECGCGHHCQHCRKVHVYKPTCAEVHTRNKLIKKTVMKEVPSYKWVVETVCDNCACGACQEAAPAPENSVQGAPQLEAPSASRTPVQRASFLQALFGGK